MIIAKMEEFIRNKIIRIYSPRLLNEIKTFVWNNNKPEAMRGYNDDLTMAFAIACWVRDTAMVVNKKEIEYTKAFMNTMKKVDHVMNTAIPGMNGYVPHNNREKKKELEQFSWIYKG